MHPLWHRAEPRRTPSKRGAGRRRCAAGSLAALALAAGCVGFRPHAPVPPELTARAIVTGYPGVRYSLPEDGAALAGAVAAAVRAAPAERGEVTLLAISGGGSQGSYGAGVLSGWTERGDRPEFQVVCGVSSGALTAPFAFLGPDYDARLRAAFTGVSSRDIYRLRNPLTVLDHDSLVSTEPMAHTLAGLIDADALRAVAAQHARGRRLYVLTTDLDAQRPVLWDLGAIAASGRADAAALFRQVMLASAAMPVAFPPQYFAVEAGGRSFDEMHVDGGLMYQVFLPLPPRGPPVGRALAVVAILNGKLSGDWMNVAPRVMPIATRTFHTIAQTHGLVNLREIARRARDSGARFACIAIPRDYSLQSHTGFNQTYMQELFELGRATVRGASGFAETLPPVEAEP